MITTLLIAWLITHLVFTVPTFRTSFRESIHARTHKTMFDSWDCQPRHYTFPLTWGKVVVALLYAATFGPLVVSSEKAYQFGSSLNSKQDSAQKFARVIGGETKEGKIERLEAEASEREKRITQLESDLLES